MEDLTETLQIRFLDLKNRDVQRNDLQKEDSDKPEKKKVNNVDIIDIAERSFFRDVYQQAIEQIEVIVKQNHAQDYPQNSDQRYKHDIQNIIAFTGRRGTGKTSAMISLAEFLSNHELLIDQNASITDSIAFKLIAEIDATTLDQNVSLIPAILSQIINQLYEELYGSNYCRKNNDSQMNDLQGIYEAANQLFNDYITGIHISSKVIDASNYLSIALKRLSFENRFRDLIAKYAKLCFKKENPYFIICIDDVDMAPCNHAELLISIHQYLMIPNIIVFLTANLKFLAPEVQTLFYKNVKPAYDASAIDRLSNEQTEEYLKKIIPSDNRITLPSWKKKDYLSIFPIKVSFYNSQENTESIYPKLAGSEFFKFIKKNDKYSITPKQMILMMIANRTKVYLDVCGMKYHFFEPTSLRNMYDLFYILYSMHNIVGKYDQRDQNEYYLQRSQNRKRLLDYIHFTMRRDYRFNAQTSEFLDELIANPIERRGQKIWGYYYQLLDSEGISQRIDSSYGVGFRPTEKYFFKADNYSFGELFRILYSSSRIGVFDHKFIKFILASYSMALPTFVENEKRKHKSEDMPYNQLIAMFGSSLIGSTWCDELFGCWKYTSIVIKNASNFNISHNEPVVQSYKANRCSIQVTPPENKIVDVLQIEKLISLLLLSPHWVTEKPIEVRKTDKKWTIDAELDPTSFLINCLLINVKIRSIRDSKTLKIFRYNDESLSLEELIIKIFNNYTLSSAKYIENECNNQVGVISKDKNGKLVIKDGIPNYVVAYHELIINISENTEPVKMIQEQFDNPFIDSPENNKGTIIDVILDYIVRDYRSHHLTNMLKHIDLIYNTIKRTITDIVYITPHDVTKKKRFENPEDPATVIKVFYDKLYAQLVETDKIYFAEGIHAHNSFATRFRSSVIVRDVLLMKEQCDDCLELKSTPIKDGAIPTTLKDVFDGVIPSIDEEASFLAILKGRLAQSLFTSVSDVVNQKITASIIKCLGDLSNNLLTDPPENIESIILSEVSQAQGEIQSILEG